MKFILELNLLTIKLGYFPAKIVGNLFLSKRNIVMEVQESPKDIWIQIARDENLKYLRIIRPLLK